VIALTSRRPPVHRTRCGDNREEQREGESQRDHGLRSAWPEEEVEGRRGPSRTPIEWTAWSSIAPVALQRAEKGGGDEVMRRVLTVRPPAKKSRLSSQPEHDRRIKCASPPADSARPSESASRNELCGQRGGR